jgi:hypothetical protein
MSTQYAITGQTYTDERQPDGTYLPVVEVAFTTTGSPPVKGVVTVPRALLATPADYADAVRIAVGNAVASHAAVEKL